MNFSQNKNELYKKYLHEISNIKFTSREIDVIACVIHNRGNKKIAELLSIGARTVDAHFYNIKSKLSRNSRDSIIDFFEKSGKFKYVKEYYLCLLVEFSFQKSLNLVAKKVNKEVVTFFINDANISYKSEESSSIVNQKLEQLQRDLKIANVILEQKTKHSVYCYTLTHKNNAISDNNESNKKIRLLFDDIPNLPFDKEQEIDCYCFSSDQNYYFVVFDLLAKIIDKPELNTIKEEFKREYNSIFGDKEENIVENDVTIPGNPNVVAVKPRSSTVLFFGSTICLILFIFSIYYIYNNYIKTSESIQDLDPNEFNLIKSRIQNAAEYYNTDQTTTELAKQNNKNIFALQKDIDYLFANLKYLNEDDILQSQFAYVACVLSSYYRWNKSMDNTIDEYLVSKYKECSSYPKNKEISEMRRCVNSRILEKAIAHYENKYKFKHSDAIKTIKYKLERESYALEDFALLSYHRGRGHFYLNELKDADKKLIDQYLDVTISTNILNHAKQQVIETFIAKRYKLIVDRNALSSQLEVIENTIRKEFVDTKDEGNLIDIAKKIGADNLKKITKLSENDLLVLIDKLNVISESLSKLSYDESEYINHYKPWSKDEKLVEVFVPKKDKFNIGLIYSEVLLTQTKILLYNTLLCNIYQNEKLIENNKRILLNSIAIVEKFANDSYAQYNWDDIGIKYIKRKVNQAIVIFMSADYGNNDCNITLKSMQQKIEDGKFDNSIISDIKSLISFLK